MEDRFTHFESYLRGELSDTEKQNLESKLTDNRFRKDFAAYQQLRSAISKRLQGRKQEEALTKQLQSMGHKYIIPKTKRLKNRTPWLIAASVSFLIIATYYAVQLNTFKPQALVSEYIQERQLLGIRGSDELFSFPDAMLAYENGEWEYAAQKLDAVPDTSSVFLDAQLYAGYAWLKAGAYQSAKDRFQQVFDLAQNPFQQANAEWHLALIHVVIDDPSSKDVILAPFIIDTKHPFHQQALALDAKLDQMRRKQKQ